MSTVQESADAGVFHGEGAFWDPVASRLRFVDMLAGDVMTIEPEGISRRHLDDVVALIRARRDGGYVVATERGFALLDADLTVEHRIPVFDHTHVRMNEGACDAAGRLYCGSMAYDFRKGGGTLYRLDPDLTVSVAWEGVTIPNGLVWTEGGTAALHADTGEERIVRYRFDPVSGELSDPETFVDLADAPGAPDGMALDAEGGLWVAMWGGGAVRRFDADGRLSDTVALPVSNVTSCAFGGAAGTTLFITTSRQDLEHPEPTAGRVFTVDAGVAGAPVNAFAG